MTTTRTYTTWRRNLLWALEPKATRAPTEAETRLWYERNLTVTEARDLFLRALLRGTR
jgi:hypothetical protein